MNSNINSPVLSFTVTRQCNKSKNKKMTMDFIRWGALSPQKHEEAKLPYNSEKRGYHTAPTVWGIYAFPKGFVYRWLLGMSESNLRQNNRFRWVRDADGNKVQINVLADEKTVSALRQKQLLLRRLNKIPKNGNLRSVQRDDDHNNGFLYWDGQARNFKYGGEIWHHLEFFYYDYWDIKYGYWGVDSPSNEKKIRIVPLPEIIERNGSWIKTSMRDYRKALKKFNDCLQHFQTFRNDLTKKTICNPVSEEDDIKSCFEVFIEKV